MDKQRATSLETARLVLWLNDKKSLCEKLTDGKLVKHYQADTGVKTSISSMTRYKKAVYPDLKPTKLGKFSGGAFLARIMALDKRLTKLEEDLGVSAKHDAA